MKKKHVQSGFTLIELLVVITIIGVLTSLFISNMVGVRERAKDARTQANLDSIKTALRLYYNDYQGYPQVADGPVEGSDFTNLTGTVVYMDEIPTFSGYGYSLPGADDENFLLQAELENEADQEICDSWARCNVGGTCTTGTDTTYYLCAN